MRQDYLRECNVQGVALVDFNAAFCKRCTQPACVRSMHGKSKFDERVTTWRERLFENVPQMDSSDPRFVEIRSKMFKSIELPVLGAANQASEWLDARAEARTLVQVPEMVVRAPEPSPPDPEPVPAPEPIVVPPRVSSSNIPQEVVLMNTTLRKGLILPGGAAALVSKPVADPWAAPAPPKDPVVKRGATIRLGGDKGDST
jgi:hypothetical protein